MTKLKSSYKPQGYNSLSPYFVVKDAEKLIEMLSHIFDAKVLRRYDLPDGSILHVELLIDDTVIMMGEASGQYPPITQLVHIYVADVVETFQKAISFGCEIIDKPIQKIGDSDRGGAFRDFAGNIWSIGAQVER